jgi:hypothetical protein
MPQGTQVWKPGWAIALTIRQGCLPETHLGPSFRGWRKIEGKELNAKAGAMTAPAFAQQVRRTEGSDSEERG